MTNIIESMKNLVQFLWWLFLIIVLVDVIITLIINLIKNKKM